MPVYYICHGLGGGFGGPGEWERVELSDSDKALDLAWECAIEDYEMYEGMHGLLDIDEIMEEEGCDEEEAQEIRQDQIESWIDYDVITEEEYLNGIERGWW